VFLALAVPERDAGSGFPWGDWTSSDTSILRSIGVCASAASRSSIPVRYSAFEAVATGTARLTVLLSPGWQPPAGASGDDVLGPIEIAVEVN